MSSVKNFFSRSQVLELLFYEKYLYESMKREKISVPGELSMDLGGVTLPFSFKLSNIKLLFILIFCPLATKSLYKG